MQTQRPEEQYQLQPGRQIRSQQQQNHASQQNAHLSAQHQSQLYLHPDGPYPAFTYHHQTQSFDPTQLHQYNPSPHHQSLLVRHCSFLLQSTDKILPSLHCNSNSVFSRISHNRIMYNNKAIYLRLLANMTFTSTHSRRCIQRSHSSNKFTRNTNIIQLYITNPRRFKTWVLVLFPPISLCVLSTFFLFN